MSDLARHLSNAGDVAAFGEEVACCPNVAAFFGVIALLFYFGSACVSVSAYLFSRFGPMPGAVLLGGAAVLIIFLWRLYAYFKAKTELKAEEERQAARARLRSNNMNKPGAPDDIEAALRPAVHNSSLTARWKSSNHVVTTASPQCAASKVQPEDAILVSPYHHPTTTSASGYWPSEASQDVPVVSTARYYPQQAVTQGAFL